MECLAQKGQRKHKFLLEVLCLLVALIGSSGTANGATTPLSKVVEPDQTGRTIVPLPQQLSWAEDGDFALKDGLQLVVGDEAEADKAAAAELQQALAVAGIESEVVFASSVSNASGAIVIGETATNLWAGRLLAQESKEEPAPLPQEGYRLKVTPEHVVITGVDARGTHWGVQTLRQLLAFTDNGPVLRGVEITDWPDFAVRGLHMFISSDLDYVQLPIIANLMPRLKLNTLVLQIDQANWESHPELWTSTAATKEQLAKVAEIARNQHIEVIPLVNLFGHMTWAFRGGSNLDIVAPQTNAYAYDPTNPKSYAFAEEILDEIIDLFHPRYINIGHDEVRMRGPVPTGEKPFGQVFVDDVKHFHDYLQERGIGTVIWADEALKPDVFPYLRQLPKDIVMVHWDYGYQPDYPEIAQLTGLGFPVQAASWYNWDNIQSLSRSARKHGAEGMMGTTWAGFFPGLTSLYQQSRQYVSYVVDGELFWNTDGHNTDALPYDPGEFYRSNVTSQGLEQQDEGFTVDLSSVANVDVMALLGKSSVTKVIDGVNQTRGTNQLIVYTPERGYSTGSNRWGLEVVVENDRVISVGGNDQAIPRNGLVISGHGSSQDWLLAYAAVGDKVSVSGGKLTLSKDEQTPTYRGLSSAMQYGEHRLNGIKFRIPDPLGNQGRNAIALRSSYQDQKLPSSVEVDVNHQAKKLWFLHSTLGVVEPLTLLGDYKIDYSDGTSLRVSLSYGVNLVAWEDVVNVDTSDRLAIEVGSHRICALEWKNPYPGKTIASITFSSRKRGSSPLLLAITGAN